MHICMHIYTHINKMYYSHIVYMHASCMCLCMYACTRVRTVVILGGHPSSGSSYGFAMHVPFTFYSQQPIREAARRRLESAVMLRALPMS